MAGGRRLRAAGRGRAIGAVGARRTLRSCRLDERVGESLVLRKSLAFLLVLFACACGSESPSLPATPPVQVRQPTLVNDAQGELSAVVRKVIDGRTIELDTGERVQVSSLAPPGTCWAASARTFAEKRLL